MIKLLKLAAAPVSLPSIQVAPATALEQQAFQQAGQNWCWCTYSSGWY